MDTNILIHNLALLAHHKPEDLQVEKDGVTLNPIEKGVAASAKDVFQVVQQMQRFTEKGKRPIWIQLNETQADTKVAGIFGLTAGQILDRTLKGELPPAPEHLERHETVILILEDEAGQPVKIQADRNILTKNSGLVGGMLTPEREYGVVKGDEIPLPGGIKKDLFLNVMIFLQGAELRDAEESEKLLEYFRIGSVLQIDPLIDDVASRLAAHFKTNGVESAARLLIILSESPELLNKIMSLLEPDVPFLKEAMIKGISHFDQEIERVEQEIRELKVEGEEQSGAKKRLESELTNLKDLQRQLKNGMVNFINKNQISLASLAMEFSEALQFITSLAPERLECADLLPFSSIDDTDLEKLFAACPNIKVLELRGSKITRLPAVENNKLEQLNLYCENLEAIPSEFTNLKNLNLLDCKKLTVLPSELTKLEHLSFRNCDGLHALPATYTELTWLSCPYSELRMQTLPATYTKLQVLEYSGLIDESGTMHFNPPVQIPETYTNLKVCQISSVIGGTLADFKNRDFWLSLRFELT